MTTLEKTIGGIVAALVVALVTYGGTALVDARQSVATLAVRLEAVERSANASAALAALVPERLARIEEQLRAALSDLAVIKADTKRSGIR